MAPPVIREITQCSGSGNVSTTRLGPPFHHKGNENEPKKTAENGKSQQPINENGIRFLPVKRFWNQPTSEERKIRAVSQSCDVSSIPPDSPAQFRQKPKSSQVEI